MLPCPEASQVALTFLGSKLKVLAETHIAGSVIMVVVSAVVTCFH